MCRPWFSACEESVHALYHVHPNPEKVLKNVVAELFSRVETCREATALQQTLCLVKLLFVVGQSAVCSVVLLERLAQRAKKARETQRIREREETVSIAISETPVHGAASTDKARDGAASSMEEEMGMAAAADAEHDKVNEAY